MVNQVIKSFGFFISERKICTLGIHQDLNISENGMVENIPTFILVSSPSIEMVTPIYCSSSFFFVASNREIFSQVLSLQSMLDC